MNGTFHAVATILHRVPRQTGELNDKHRAGAPRLAERDSDLRDFGDGWIRVAL